MSNDIILTMGKHTYVAKMKWINEGKGYYLVTFPSLKGCITMGYSLDEAVAMAKDVLELWLICLKDEHKPFPREKNSLLKKVANMNIPVSVSV